MMSEAIVRPAPAPPGQPDADAVAQAHAPEAAGAHAAAEHKSHPPEVPSGLDLLASLKSAQRQHIVSVAPFTGEVSLADVIHSYQNTFYSLLVVTIVAIVLARMLRRSSIRTPGRFQATVEMLVETFRDLVYGILGEKNGRRYLPYIGSLFFFIWLNNLLGLVPFMRSPTSVWTTTGALAALTFLYVQFAAVRHNGPVRYLYHLMGEPKGESLGMTIFMWTMSIVLLLPLHLVSEIIRPVSLALRLFGNILGEDILLGVFSMMGLSILHAALGLPSPDVAAYGIPGIPLHLPFFFLALLTSTVQAVVFSLLSLIYIMMVLPHEEHEEAAH